MEFSQVFSFLSIIKESIQLIPKIWKFTALIAAISLILPSLFFLLFCYSFKVVMDGAIQAADSNFTLMFLVLFMEIIFLFVYMVCLHLSGISTVIVSAAAYVGKRLSPSDLASRVRKTWRQGLKTSCRVSRKSSLGVLLVGVLVAFVISMDLINPITIFLMSVLLIAIIIYQLKSSVGMALARVASIVEESGDVSKGAERGEQLAEGQILKGFMLNLFINIMFVVTFLVLWMTLGGKAKVNLATYGLLFVNLMGLFTIFVSILHTVFYFQCLKHHGEEVDVLPDDQYTKLPTSA